MMTLCIAMARLTVQMDHARRQGVTASQASAVIAQSPERNREMAKTVAWYVYEANPDSGVSSEKLASEVRASCEATQQEIVSSGSRHE